MPIVAIISQPSTDSIKASYRPIVFKVSATKTDGTPIPPVVYCDVYINGDFYRSLSRTYYANLQLDRTEWEFDVQDVIQEYLGKFVAENGANKIVEATPLVCQIQVKFRSSGVNSDGFIIPEDIAPIQATSNTLAISGTGTPSNLLWVVNTVLQHDDNQDLPAHLNSFKTGIWDLKTYPLTHRPKKYYVCKDDSDYFPILSDKYPDHIDFVYRLRGAIAWNTNTAPSNCISVTFSTPSLPQGHVGQPYLAQIKIFGSLPIAIIGNIIYPAWMLVRVIGDTLTISGIPSGVMDDLVSFNLVNCGEPVGLTWSTRIVVVDTACIPASIQPLSLPDATLNTPYNYTIPVNGTMPIRLGSIVKPPWMSINVAGSNIVLSGTPTTIDTANRLVSFHILNCSTSDLPVYDYIDVLSNTTPNPTSQRFLIQIRYSNSINTVCNSPLEYGYVTYPTIVNGQVMLSASQVIFTTMDYNTPLLGYSFVQDAGTGQLFMLDPNSGTILNSLSQTC